MPFLRQKKHDTTCTGTGAKRYPAEVSTKSFESSAVHILAVRVVDLALLQRGEVEEVRGPVHLVVELLGVGQLQVVLHVGVVADTCRQGKVGLTREQHHRLA